MAITVTGITPLLEVFDLPVSMAFYRDVLGFELVSGDDSWWCMLKLGGVSLSAQYGLRARRAASGARSGAGGRA
jgi:catechol 2,3-dioxygenase-like lactoylglutathione lyase family enzyme